LYTHILAPLLLGGSLASAAGVHRMKLQKLAPAKHDPMLEASYLAEKYGGSQVRLRETFQP